MDSAKPTATVNGKSAGQPTSAKLGWITRSVPMKPTIQAWNRRAPTSSPKTKWPRSSMMKGITKAIAMASASSRKRSEVNIAAIPMMCSTVRTRVSRSTRGLIRIGVRMTAA